MLTCLVSASCTILCLARPHRATAVHELTVEYVDALEKVRLKEGIRTVMSISAVGNKYLQDNKHWDVSGCVAGGVVLYSLRPVQLCAWGGMATLPLLCRALGRGRCATRRPRVRVT